MALVEIDDSGVRRVLDGIRLNAETVDRDLIGEIMQEGIDRVMQSEGEWGAGEAWGPLSESYLKARPDRVGQLMLNDTGVLGNTQVLNGVDYVEAASPAEYAAWHVLGTSRMPVRDFLAVGEEWLTEEVGKLILQDIERGTNQ